MKREPIALRHMVPTSLGMNFAECFLLLDASLVEPQLRASMEHQIAMIANGDMAAYDVLADNLAMFSSLFRNFQQNLHRALHLFTQEKKSETGTTHSLLDFLK